jgi:nicotinamidase-related amidase
MSKLTLTLRTGNGYTDLSVDGGEVALILIDVWDKHWCSGMEKRGEILAKKINQLLPAVRANGVRVVHAPSECAGFYQDNDRRNAFLNAPVRRDSPGSGSISALPTDDKVPAITWNGSHPAPDGFVPPLKQDGCDGTNTGHHWSREHPFVGIVDPDIVAFENESYRIVSFLRGRNIKYLVYSGAATNECVLYTRNTSIYYMKKLIAAATGAGVQCYLARDLTDTMYVPPADRPFESHDSGTAGTVHYIESSLAVPSILSADLAVPT